MMTAWMWGAVNDRGELRVLSLDEGWVDEQVADSDWTKVQIALDAIPA